MILLLDVGNTRIKWAWHQAGWLGAMEVVVHRGQDLSAVLAQSLRAGVKPARVVVANVAGVPAEVAIEQWSGTYWGVRPEFVTSELFAHGVRNGYATPYQLGIDRWLGLVAARISGAGSCCVVSCGTAVTVDALTGDGVHLGGAIAPGFCLMRDALNTGTAQVRAEPEELKIPALLADNTGDAVSAGIGYSLAGLVERAYRQLAQTQSTPPRCVITGGDAQRLGSYLSIPHTQVADLVLRGLARVASVPK